MVSQPTTTLETGWVKAKRRNVSEESGPKILMLTPGKTFHPQNSHPLGLGFRQDFAEEGPIMGFSRVDRNEHGIEGKELDGSRKDGWNPTTSPLGLGL
jgi:hypothetical protein